MKLFTIFFLLYSTCSFANDDSALKKLMQKELSTYAQVQENLESSDSHYTFNKLRLRFRAKGSVDVPFSKFEVKPFIEFHIVKK